MDFRTDFADERIEICKNHIENTTKNSKVKNANNNDKKANEKKHNYYDGINVSNEKISDNIEVCEVKIVNEKGEKTLGKKIGTYTTINIKDLEIITKEQLDCVKDVFAKQIKTFIEDAKSLLIIGLGNSETTADSIGPKVVNNLKITRHILNYEPSLLPKNTISISALAPGVLGTTGIETEEIVKSAVNIVKPDKVIVIDAMATSNTDRLLKTIQISNTGIEPGAGINNKRKEISITTIGIPVIAIGVPTVVDSAVIVAQSLKKMSEKYDEFNFLKDSSFEEMYKLIKINMNDNLVVMPKDIDYLVDNLKEIISYGINNCA